MAYMNASIKEWPNFKQKLPSGLIWATPDRSQGYLRRGVLQAIARKIGDHVLDDKLIESGTFVDTEPATGSPVRDHLAYDTITSVIEDQMTTGKKEAEDSDEEVSSIDNSMVD